MRRALGFVMLAALAACADRPVRALRLAGRAQLDGVAALTVARSGGRVLVGHAAGGVAVVEPSDPAARLLSVYRTRQVDSTAPPQHTVVVAGRGNQAYVAYEILLAELVDLDADGGPRLRGRHRPRGLVRAVVMDDRYAYLGLEAAAPGRIPVLHDPSSVSGTGALEVVELSADGIPRSASLLALPRGVSDVGIHDRLAFLAHDDGGLTVVDVSDPRRPAVVGELPALPGGGASARGSARLALAPRLGRLYLTHSARSDVGDPDPPAASLRVVDVHDPANPTVRAAMSVDRGASTADVLVDALGALALVFAGDLVLIDATNPAAPAIVAREPFPGGEQGRVTFDMAVDRKHVYLVAGDGGLWVYDLLR